MVSEVAAEVVVGVMLTEGGAKTQLTLAGSEPQEKETVPAIASGRRERYCQCANTAAGDRKTAWAEGCGNADRHDGLCEKLPRCSRSQFHFPG